MTKSCLGITRSNHEMDLIRETLAVFRMFEGPCCPLVEDKRMTDRLIGKIHSQDDSRPAHAVRNNTTKQEQWMKTFKNIVLTI